jgi:hypothetical protein
MTEGLWFDLRKSASTNNVEASPDLHGWKGDAGIVE